MAVSTDVTAVTAGSVCITPDDVHPSCPSPDPNPIASRTRNKVYASVCSGTATSEEQVKNKPESPENPVPISTPGMNLGPCDGSSVIDSAIYSESMLAAPYVSSKMSEDLPAGATKYHEDFVKCEDIQSANIIRDCKK